MSVDAGIADQGRSRSPYVWMNAALAAAVCVVAFASLMSGASGISAADIWRGLLSSDGAPAIIMREIRLPRMLLSISVGACLGLSGAAIQGLTRNPLAEPAILGAPQAAALGAVLVLYSGLAPANSMLLAFAAIAGAALSMGLTIVLLQMRRNILTLLLAGLGIGSLAGAAMSLVISMSANPYAVMEIVFWLMGSFEDRSMVHVWMALPFFLGAAVMLFSCRAGYTALALGEEVAQSLGINVFRLSLLTAAGVALGVGAAVAVSGAIGFVGLVAPHIVRPFCHGDAGRSLLPTALCGALLTGIADICVRLIPATSEVRIGVVTALIGAPFFIWLVVSRRAMSGGSS